MTGTAAPIFVFGALRSGTTLFRLMLNSHERLGNPGEVDFLFDCIAPDPAQPTGWRYDLAALQASRIFRAHGLELKEGLDGLDLLHDLIAQFQARVNGVLTMNVHRQAGRIVAALPEARFIHLLRDPRDVARSSIGMGWAGVSYYGVDHWMATERGWDEASPSLDEGQVLTIRFETLMADIEGELARACAFLGVPFSVAMLDYHLDTTYGPPDPGIAGQWRRRATPREIALLEGKCGGMIAARGYPLAGDPARPGPAEVAGLALRNKTGRWRRNIRKVGLPLFVGERVSRWLGLGRMNARMRRGIDDRTAKVLK